jgi:hypothetical protein
MKGKGEDWGREWMEADELIAKGEAWPAWVRDWHKHRWPRRARFLFRAKGGATARPRLSVVWRRWQDSPDEITLQRR